MGRRQHGADPPWCFADDPATEAQTKVLFKLQLYLTDALVKLATLQGDVTEQVRAHLGVTDRLGQRRLGRVDAVSTGSTKQLILGDEVAHLWQIKHLMHPIRFVMGQHLVATTEAVWLRVVSRNGQAGIGRMTLTPLPLVARLGTTFFTGSRTRPDRWRAAKAISGGWLGRVATVLVEAVFQLGDTVQQLMYQLVGLLESQ